MKHAGYVAMVVLGVASIGFAQPGVASKREGEVTRPYFSSRWTAHPGKVFQGYIDNLQSINDGVVESSIAHIAFMVLVFPEIDRNSTIEKLEQLSLYGSTPGIRYKAYLANLVAGNASAFGRLLDQEYTDAEGFFIAIAQRAQAALLGEAVTQ